MTSILAMMYHMPCDIFKQLKFTHSIYFWKYAWIRYHQSIKNTRCSILVFGLLYSFFLPPPCTVV